MRWERIIWVVALLLVGGGGFFTGELIGVQAGEQNRALAIQQFFGGRGGPTSARGGQGGGQFGGQGNGQGGGQFGGRGGMAGTVSSVSGNTITITNRAGQTVQVQLAANGTVRKQVDGQLSDIMPGAQITAFGTQSGDTFQAT